MLNKSFVICYYFVRHVELRGNVYLHSDDWLIYQKASEKVLLLKIL